MALLAVPVAAATVTWQGWRRFGPGALLALPAALLGLEAAGGDGPADLRSHLMGAVAIVVLSGSWWVGVVAGAAGEAAHVRHQHA